MTKTDTQDTPAATILEYLESHESICAKEARDVCRFTLDYDARRMLYALENRGLVKRVHGKHKGGMRYTKGRYFGEWRQLQSNGFQTDLLTGDQYEIPGFLKPPMPGTR